MAWLFPYAGKELTSKDRDYISGVRIRGDRKSLKTMRRYMAPPKEEEVQDPTHEQLGKISAPASLKRILYEVCKKHNHHPDDVVGTSRVFAHCTTRREFIWRARTETNASFSQIAKIVKRDHSTVIHAYQQVLSGKYKIDGERSE